MYFCYRADNFNHTSPHNSSKLHIFRIKKNKNNITLFPDFKCIIEKFNIPIFFETHIYISQKIKFKGFQNINVLRNSI